MLRKINNPLFFCCIILIIIQLLSLIGNSFLFADDKTLQPSCSIGVGYTDARKYSGALVQIEFKSQIYIWDRIRPQFSCHITEFYSGFCGVGLGWELYVTKHILIVPSFTPGIYWRGKGKDIGCPLEFRSAVELVYEMPNRCRLGAQIFHISNAHLSHRNPGYNALVLYFGFPLSLAIFQN